MKLLDLLRAVGKRPGMYIGGPKSSRSIWHLHSLLVGYQSGALGRPELEGDDILDVFTFWVCTRFDVPDGPMNWAGHIWRHCGEDDEAAFKLFFELLEEYVKDRGRLGPEAIKARFIEMIPKWRERRE